MSTQGRRPAQQEAEPAQQEAVADAGVTGSIGQDLAPGVMLSLDNRVDEVGSHVRAFEVRLQASGPGPDDEVFSERFYELFDGLVAWHEGQLFVTVSGRGNDGKFVAMRLISQLENELALTVTRVDLDLVDISEIAFRTGHSRQNIQQWVTGMRRGGGFPRPLGVIGGKRIWSWGSVDAWLRRQNIRVGDEIPLTLEEIEQINVWLERRPVGSSEQTVFIATFQHDPVPKKIIAPGFFRSIVSPLTWSRCRVADLEEGVSLGTNCQMLAIWNPSPTRLHRSRPREERDVSWLWPHSDELVTPEKQEDFVSAAKFIEE